MFLQKLRILTNIEKPRFLSSLLNLPLRVAGNGLIDENDFMQWVTKIQAIQGLDVSQNDTEEEITRDLLAAFKFVPWI